MKWILFFWALPLVILGTWYGLSYYDLNFGWLILSRPMHDLVFEIYGDMLGIPPASVPPLVLKAICVDTLILLALFAFRRRAKIIAWWRARQASQPSAAALAIDESLSSAP